MGCVVYSILDTCTTFVAYAMNIHVCMHACGRLNSKRTLIIIIRPKKKLYWHNPTYPKNTPYPRSLGGFCAIFVRNLHSCHKKL